MNYSQKTLVDIALAHPSVMNEIVSRDTVFRRHLDTEKRRQVRLDSLSAINKNSGLRSEVATMPGCSISLCFIPIRCALLCVGMLYLDLLCCACHCCFALVLLTLRCFALL